MVQCQTRFSSLSGFYSHNLFPFSQITEVHLCNRRRHQVGWPRSLVRERKMARKYLSILSDRLPYKNCTIENIIVKFSVVTMSKIIPFIRTFCMQSLHLASSWIWVYKQWASKCQNVMWSWRISLLLSNKSY